jgi:hypothetical protein
VGETCEDGIFLNPYSREFKRQISAPRVPEHPFATLAGRLEADFGDGEPCVTFRDSHPEGKRVEQRVLWTQGVGLSSFSEFLGRSDLANFERPRLNNESRQRRFTTRPLRAVITKRVRDTARHKRGRRCSQPPLGGLTT